MTLLEDKWKAQPPPSPGRYWYDCLLLPAGVGAELVTVNGTPGVRFCFTTIKQADELGQYLSAFALQLGHGTEVARKQSEDLEPPLVGEHNV
jgi:hypothetical protein